jgi:hypothetical protein
MFNFDFYLSSLMLLALIVIEYLYHRNKSPKNLVFSSVGDINNADSWISHPEKKNFDLVVYYYGNKEKPEIKADLVIKRKGLKFENFYHYLNTHNINNYESVWVVDDDIIMDTLSINKMFNIFKQYKLWIAQPSFDKNSIANHAVIKNNPGCILRYTNFIENGVAVISTQIIPLLINSFRDARTGFGAEYVWNHILNYPKDKVAVIDAVTCCHPHKGFSALDQVVPRELHKVQGAEFLKKYGVIPSDWEPTENNPWPNPYVGSEYSRVRSGKR